MTWVTTLSCDPMTNPATKEARLRVDIFVQPSPRATPRDALVGGGSVADLARFGRVGETPGMYHPRNCTLITTSSHPCFIEFGTLCIYGKKIHDTARITPFTNYFSSLIRPLKPTCRL